MMFDKQQSTLKIKKCNLASNKLSVNNNPRNPRKVWYQSRVISKVQSEESSSLEDFKESISESSVQLCS